MTHSRIVEAAYQRSFPGLSADHDRKKIRVLGEAIHFIATRGVQELNLTTLAKSLGMSRSHVKYYFADVEALLAGVVKLSIATAQQITIALVAEAKDPREAVLGVASAAFRWAADHREQLVCLMMFYFYTGFDARMLELSNYIRDTGLNRIAELTAKHFGVAVEANPAVRDRAIEIQSTITGFVISALIHPGAGTVSDYERRCLALTEFQLNRAI